MYLLTYFSKTISSHVSTFLSKLGDFVRGGFCHVQVENLTDNFRRSRPIN